LEILQQDTGFGNDMFLAMRIETIFVHPMSVLTVVREGRVLS